MKTTLLIFFLTSLIHFGTFGQAIYGNISNIEGDPVEFCRIRDTLTNKIVESDKNGAFIFSFLDSCVLELSQPNYEIELFAISLNRDSILNKTFQLRTKIQLVDEVIVSSKRMQTVVDQKDVNVIDYIPFDNIILTLKSYKRERILSIEGTDTTYGSFPLGKVKPNELFLDCFDNIHLLSDDSAYQVWIDASLQFISRSSRKEFDKIVHPCVADFGQSKVFENFSNRNKKYTLSAIDAESKQKDHFLIVHDEIGETLAQEVHDSIILRYFMVTPEYANIIIAGAWSGDLMELVSLDHYLHYLISWYLKISASELNIQSFQYENHLYTMDQYSDSIRVYNDANELIESKYYPFKKSSRVFDIIVDRANGMCYEYVLKNGIYYLNEIPMKEGQSSKEINLKEAPLCRNIKAHNNWVYFMVKQNDFYQINRIYLGEKLQN